jgi:hypothetical protein
VYIYRPVADLEVLTAQVVSNVLDRMGGEVDRVICRVLEIDPDVGADAIAEVKRKLGAMRRERRR